MSSPSPLLQPFRQAYQNLQLLPLQEPQERRAFYVEFESTVLEELEQVFEDCAAVNNKLIFTGHRGCGKSTLLGSLARKMSSNYFVVFFSIAELIELSDVNHINILFAIAVQMMEQAETQQVEIPPKTREAFYEWFATKTQTSVDTLSAEASAGFNLFEIIKGKLQADAYIRNEIKQEFERKISDLIQKVDQIATVIEAVTQQDILVIIDDLDKLEPPQAREIYYDHIRTLFKPKFRILFTIPIATLREIDIRSTVETESNNQIVVMEVVKLYPKPENDLLERRQRDIAEARPPEQATVERFKEILHKRLPPELIEPETVDAMILQSGGVLRELIRLANRCCSKCLLQIRRDPNLENLKINTEILAAVTNDFRNDFAVPLSYPHYKILKQIYTRLTPSNQNKEEWQLFLNLLHGLYIMEYRNSDLWYDVHPIVVELLEKRGMLLPS